MLSYSRRPRRGQKIYARWLLEVFKKIHKFNICGSLGKVVRRIMVNNAWLLRLNLINKYAISESNMTKYVLVETPDEDRSNIVIDILAQKISMDSIQKLRPIVSKPYLGVFYCFWYGYFAQNNNCWWINISEGTSKSNLAKSEEPESTFRDRKEYLNDEGQDTYQQTDSRQTRLGLNWSKSCGLELTF